MKGLAIFLLKRPLAAALLTTLASLLAGAAAILMADFGQPLWLFAPLFLWLGTIGLPATVGVLAVAAGWGWIPAMTGIVPFAICAALVAVALQSAVFLGCARVLRQHRRP